MNEPETISVRVLLIRLHCRGASCFGNAATTLTRSLNCGGGASTGGAASAEPGGSSGGGGSSASSTAARARRPGALSTSTPSRSAAERPRVPPTAPRSSAAVARFRVSELCRCIGGGGVARLSDELCTGSVLITSFDDLTVTDAQNETLSRLTTGFA